MASGAVRQASSHAKRSLRAVVLLFLVLVVAGCYGPGAPGDPGVASTGLEASRPPLTEQSNSSGVVEEVHLSATSWGMLADTGTGIYLAKDGALVRLGAFPDVASVRSELIELDSDQLAVATAEGAIIRVYVSDDRAATWRLVGSTSVDTVDGIVGIDLASTSDTFVVLAEEQSSSAFRFARIATSADGGMTWKTSQAPIGGKLSRADSMWWLTGGVSSNQVFRSVDGSDWHELKVPVPAEDWTAERAFGGGAVGVVVPITIHDQDLASSVVFLATQDGGQSWSEAGSASVPSSASGSTIPSAVAADGSWVLVYVDGSKVISGRFGLDGVKIVSPNGLPQNVTEVEMSGLTLTVVATPSSCPTGKDSCVSSSTILQSPDGGQTWEPLE